MLSNNMAGRNRVYRPSSEFRYKLKMADYMSRGGRAPLVLVMETVDAMTSGWSAGFFAYRVPVNKAFEQVKAKVELPSVYWGIVKGQMKKMVKLVLSKGITYDDAFSKVVADLGISPGDPVYQALEVAKDALAAVLPKTPVPASPASP